MYAALWRRLPGRPVTKVVLAAVLLAAVLAVLFTVVFPWAAQLVPGQDPALT